LIAYFLSNRCAKQYENPTILSKVTAKNVGDVFLRHTAVMTSAAKPVEALAGTRGTDSWLDGTDIDKHFGPDLPLLFKFYEICSVNSQENIVATRYQILRLKCTKFNFG